MLQVVRRMAVTILSRVVFLLVAFARSASPQYWFAHQQSLSGNGARRKPDSRGPCHQLRIAESVERRLEERPASQEYTAAMVTE